MNVDVLGLVIGQIGSSIPTTVLTGILHVVIRSMGASGKVPRWKWMRNTLVIVLIKWWNTPITY